MSPSFASLFSRNLLAARPQIVRCQEDLSQKLSSFLLRSKFHPSVFVASASRTFPRKTAFPSVLKAAGVVGVGLGISTLSRPAIYCDTPAPPPPSVSPQDFPPPPPSSVSFYELSFGTVTGICAGIFIKKGAKALAWFLGGIFVLLQYLGSESLVRVDWGRMSSRFENTFHGTDKAGLKRQPTISSLWGWLVNFLTADFQPRASFLAGFALGLRIG